MTTWTEEDLARFIAEGGQIDDPGYAEAVTQAQALPASSTAKRGQPEHDEQVALFRWAEMQSGGIPELALLFAIPNGGDRHPAVAAKLKAEGVKKGVPDICLPVARRGYHALYIEMKAPGGRVKPEQREWHIKLQGCENRVEVCIGWESAKDVLLDYLK
jgi:hypothetical protein